MELSNIFSMLGGLALFLYGMNMMSNGLELAAGNKMKSILMNLNQAVGIIMGANIGTTITGQLIAINITALAPLFAFIGVAMIVFFKSKKLDAIGTVIGGLGILFIGMETMSKAMVPLRTMPEFVGFMYYLVKILELVLLLFLLLLEQVRMLKEQQLFIYLSILSELLFL